MKWELDYFNSGEWQVVDERLKDLKGKFNPSRKNLFRALELVSFDACKVMVCGQDPYPDSRFATGVAFSVPDGEKIPPTLSMIFDEYESDLHYPRPSSGTLEKWATEGVLLWNVVPSCETGHSLSHDWEEWHWLTGEIIEKLKAKGIVFVFLGTRARAYASLVHDAKNCRVIEASHPSPRALLSAKEPFRGSRIFSRTNDALNTLGLGAINWRL